jgi:hypothetical protein
LQGVRERSATISSGFTPKGLISVLANQLLIIHSTLIQVRNELAPNTQPPGEYQCPDNFVVNGLLASAITGLQAVQDSIASFCHREVPDVAFTKTFLYFSEYPFNQTEFHVIRSKKSKLYSFKFNGKNINDLANQCKHELPWLGSVSALRVTGSSINWVQDIGDDKHTPLFLNVVVPVFIQTKEILGFQGQKYKTGINIPPI